MYGRELILDLYECNVNTFNRDQIKLYLEAVCSAIDMKRADLYFWDYVGFEEEEEQAPAHLTGTSAIQFISTSNITIHAIKALGELYINLFSCKDFDPAVVVRITKEYFSSELCDSNTFFRGLSSQYNMEEQQ
jgi:S-adenosylmethionine/arginine decarboxylase-like enzyme